MEPALLDPSIASKTLSLINIGLANRSPPPRTTRWPIAPNSPLFSRCEEKRHRRLILAASAWSAFLLWLKKIPAWSRLPSSLHSPPSRSKSLALGQVVLIIIIGCLDLQRSWNSRVELPPFGTRAFPYQARRTGGVFSSADFHV